MNFLKKLLLFSASINISVFFLFLYIFTIYERPKDDFCSVDSYRLVHNKHAKIFDPIVTLLKDGRPIVHYSRKAGFSLFEVSTDIPELLELPTLMLQDRDDDGVFDAVSYVLLNDEKGISGNVLDLRKDGVDIKVVNF